MRRDGDRLIAHVASAKETVVLVSPFIKAGVLRSLFRHIRKDVSVKIVTRWIPSEVALGVSDLEVFDIVSERPKSSLLLLDRLHAKLYTADEKISGGSANLTATALGWVENPNLELLIDLPPDDDAVRMVLAQLAEAVPATEAERDRVAEMARLIEKPALGDSKDVRPQDTPSLWLPSLAAPARLFQAYVERSRERLTSDVLKAADKDLTALAISPSLGEKAFNAAVAAAMSAMPAIAHILVAAADDLTDEDGIAEIERLADTSEMPAAKRWLIVRDWFTYFFAEDYEIAPQAFVLRRRPGPGH